MWHMHHSPPPALHVNENKQTFKKKRIIISHNQNFGNNPDIAWVNYNYVHTMKVSELQLYIQSG